LSNVQFNDVYLFKSFARYGIFYKVNKFCFDYMLCESVSCMLTKNQSNYL